MLVKTCKDLAQKKVKICNNLILCDNPLPTVAGFLGHTVEGGVGGGRDRQLVTTTEPSCETSDVNVANDENTWQTSLLVTRTRRTS